MTQRNMIIGGVVLVVLVILFFAWGGSPSPETGTPDTAPATEPAN